MLNIDKLKKGDVFYYVNHGAVSKCSKKYHDVNIDEETGEEYIRVNYIGTIIERKKIEQNINIYINEKSKCFDNIIDAYNYCIMSEFKKLNEITDNGIKWIKVLEKSRDFYENESQNNKVFVANNEASVNNL